MVREEGFELFHAFRALDLRRALRDLVIEVLPQRAVPTAAVGGVVERLGSVRSGGGKVVREEGFEPPTASV